MSTESTQWDDDVLDRKPTGDFLYEVVIQRYSTDHAQPDKGALCIAIDADWGAGKSFFVNRWSQDIELKKHPVMKFDAWVNDLADDPLLGFMSALQDTLDKLANDLPAKEQAKRSIRSSLALVKKQASRAIIPTLKAITKGVIKKTTTVDFDELTDQISSSSLEVDDAFEVAGTGLEEFFDKALEAHSNKQKSIGQLKELLGQVLHQLEKTQSIKLPFFIMVDELDRCRPDYAIRLLEGVKHLFDVDGICFIFSTNLDQLSASARAIYGSDFSGYRYLKRFFSFEYRLPNPSGINFSYYLSSKSLLKDLPVCGSLPEVRGVKNSIEANIEIIAKEFELIASSFRLDLRSQSQVFLIAEMASVGLKKANKIFPIYLLFLSAVFHTGKKLFSDFSPDNDFTKLPNKFNSLDMPIRPIKYNKNIYSTTAGRSVTEAKTDIFHIIEVFHISAQNTISSINNTFTEDQESGYPRNLRLLFSDENYTSTNDLPSISKYHALVSNTGQFNMGKND